MLLNVIVAVPEEKLRERVLRILQKMDVVTSVLTESRNLWQHIGSKACDVLLLSRTFLPEDIPEEIHTIKEF